MKQKSQYDLADLNGKKNLTHGQKVRLAKAARRKAPEVQISYHCEKCECEYDIIMFRKGDAVVCKNCKGELTENMI